jgi:hypothetical protein
MNIMLWVRPRALREDRNVAEPSWELLEGTLDVRYVEAMGRLLGAPGAG